MVWISVWRLYKDKMVRGFSAASMLFFTAWSFWNLYYYPFLDQWASFAGGISIGTANLAWITLAYKYRGR
jgi:hypothetical protein